MARLLHMLLAVFLVTGTTLAVAADSQEETVYGWELMTEQERAEHREKMRSLKTKEERATYRRQMHEKMQARAKERGVEINKLPPPAAGRGEGYGSGQGRGGGYGSGQGRGGGYGSGQGRGK